MDNNSSANAVNENYWNVQKNKIAEFLYDYGYNRTTAMYKAKECVDKRITYTEFITMQGDALRFQNNSVKAKEEQVKEVLLKNNIKRKKTEKTFVKKVMTGALIVTFASVIFVGGSHIKNSLNTNEKFGELAVNISNTQVEEMEEPEVLNNGKDLSQFNDMAGNIVNKNKKLVHDSYNMPHTELDYDGLSRDILSICGNRPEFLDTVLYNVFTNIDDAEIENDNADKDLRTSNQLYHMDNVLNTMKPIADKYGYDEICKELNNDTTFADYMLEIDAEENIEAFNEYGSIVSEYNEIVDKTTFNYAYSHLSDTKDMNKLLKGYSKIMNKKVDNQLDDLMEYYNQLNENAEMNKDGKGRS